ncbi:hypothetical protein [Amycolatopsis sp. NPDC006125]|uniref:hypothetical protein n=1 Tax=Amycolatopsis sp. NPDC006125 TaxID=3156730 RepID=UPI0033B74B78
MTGLAVAASTLEHLPLPLGTVNDLDEELVAVEQLTAGLVAGTGAGEELLGRMQLWRTETIEHARAGLQRIQHTLRATAADIRAANTSSPPATPLSAEPWRAVTLANVTRRRHQHKDIEAGLRKIEELGYGVEQRRNGHFHAHCPCGDCPTVIVASTPRNATAALGQLRRVAARGCHTRRSAP